MTFEEAKELLVEQGQPVHREGWRVKTCRLIIGTPSKVKLHRWAYSTDDEETGSIVAPPTNVQPVDLGATILMANNDDEVLAEDCPLWYPRDKDLTADDWQRFE